LNTDAFAQRTIVTSVPVLAQQLHRSLIRGGEAFQYFDRRCFTRAVWTKQAKTLAYEDFQIQSVDGCYVCEPLYQTRAA
jgi:hypothetical protein